MNHEQPLIERRQHMRVNARGAVILRAGGQEIHGRGVVISHTNVNVRCELGFTVLSMAGMSVEIEMRLDGDAETRFIAHGRVVRVLAADHTLIIALTILPEPLAMLLDTDTGNAVIAPINVMVVDGDRARRTQVSEAFRAEGCHVVEAGTPLEALDALTNVRRVIDLIAVADTAPESVGIELRDYLDGAHAEAVIISVGDAASAPTRPRLDPLEAQGALRAHVKSLLQLRPWRSLVSPPRIDTRTAYD